MASTDLQSSSPGVRGASRRLHGFAARLVPIVVLAGVVRLVYALAVAPPTTGFFDGYWNASVGRAIADGRGFVLFTGALFDPDARFVPTATHPPLYPLVLALADTVGMAGDTAQRSLGALFGAGTVCGVGLLGRRVGGERLGLLAAGVAALYPLLIAADGALLSETLYGVIIAFTLLSAWRLGERPSAARAAVVGLGLGLATLTRSEAILLVPLMLLPLAWRGGRHARWAGLAAGTACFAVVIAPWVARNWDVFGRPLLSTNEGGLVAQTNCDQTYSGPDLGWFAPACARVGTGDEARQTAAQRREGLEYARDHADRLPVVLSVRLLRAWGLYQPFRSAEEQGRDTRIQKVGIVLFYPLALSAIAGIAVLRRRRGPLIVLVAPLVVASVVAFASYGSVRLRYLAEVPVVVLAAAGAMAAYDRSRQPRRGMGEVAPAPPPSG
jgi:4-amino-4-deoxy-L-arabinose transferase-like glycosyltransferase